MSGCARVLSAVVLGASLMARDSSAQNAAQTNDALPRAIQLFQHGRLSDAEAQLSALVRAGASGEAMYYLGRVYFAEDSMERAVKTLESAVHLDPSSSEAHDWLARTYTVELLHSGKFRQFILARRVRDELLMAVARDPENAVARYDLARFYLKAPAMVGGNAGKAKEHQAELARRGSLYAHFVTADIAEVEHDTTRGASALEAAIREAPDSAIAYVNAAAYYRRMHDWAAAWQAVEAYAARHVDDDEVDFEIGATGARAGQQLDRSARALTAYLARRWHPGMPTHASAHFHLGLIYELQGDRAGARREFESAAALQPQNEEMQAALKRVR